MSIPCSCSTNTPGFISLLSMPVHSSLSWSGSPLLPQKSFPSSDHPVSLFSTFLSYSSCFFSKVRQPELHSVWRVALCTGCSIVSFVVGLLVLVWFVFWFVFLSDLSLGSIVLHFSITYITVAPTKNTSRQTKLGRQGRVELED